MNSYRKVKTVAKDVRVHGPELKKKVLQTMKTISDIVGATLGPSGRPVLIERQEYGLPNIFTKDGVTVFRNLGFTDPVAHSIMEAARDASIRTATEAGDGTTTATVLSEAIVRYTAEYSEKNPKVTPQKIVRELEHIFRNDIEPLVKKLSIKPDENMLSSVARLSANGDVELADNVMKCFDMVGDDGNITIVEQTGQSGYQIETVKGFPISIGYEDSCGKLSPVWINDRPKNRCYVEKPVFVLYFGALTDIQTAISLLQLIGKASGENYAELGLDKKFNHNVVLVATGFSETVLTILSNNFNRGDTINVVPLVTPKNIIQNSELHFLHDLSAITGAKVFDPITAPLDSGTLGDLGYGIEAFEMGRYRSTVFGIADESLVIARAEEIKASIEHAEGKLDAQILMERMGKLTGGIAKLKVIGPTSGEQREKRDRAEDAICAVRGALKHGCLPGGGWTLKTVMDYCSAKFSDNQIVLQVLIPSLKEPIHRIMQNCGLNDEEIGEAYSTIGVEYVEKSEKIKIPVPFVYDAWNHKRVNAVEAGILDSTPAVLEAIRNSISIASILGTLGGTIVYPRDIELERREAIDSGDFMKEYLSANGVESAE